MHVGILGGTGPAGRGLALRLAMAGHHSLVGSRDAERAAAVADDLRGRVGLPGSISGVANADVATADVVVMATPWDAVGVTLRPLAGVLEGRVVISMVNALAKDGREFLPLVPPRGSMAGAVAALVPGAMVAASFHHLPASEMEDPAASLDADVLVCSDHPEATAATLSLIADIPGLSGVDAGSLAQAAAIEAFTAVLITVNIRHRVHAAVRLAGLDRE